MKTHWSVDEKKLAKHPVQYAKWKLEQRINFGIGEEKINEKDLRAHWDSLDIDPYKRRALALALGFS